MAFRKRIRQKTGELYFGSAGPVTVGV